MSSVDRKKRRNEFPPWIREGPVDRRTALKLLAASAAFATTACSPPGDEIVPYVDMPERLLPGEPLYFATALTLGGYAQPVVGTTFDGRPTKLAPNPSHPFGGAGSDAFSQAAVLSLYDPDRTGTVLRSGKISTWDDAAQTIAEKLDAWRKSGGTGLRILTEPITSPTLRAEIAALLADYPEAHWHVWDSLPRENVFEGARLAFGRRLEPLYRLDRVRTVVSLDGDFLGPGPLQVHHAQGFAAGRRARRDSATLTRLHVAEPTMTLTGAAADRRLAVRRRDVDRVAAALARLVDSAAPSVGQLSDDIGVFVRIAAQELLQSKGDGLVVAGEAQPPEVHAAAHWMNQRIGAIGSSIDFVPPAGEGDGMSAATLEALVDAIDAGDVEAVVILGGNPAYTTPAELKFVEALKRVPTSIRHGLYTDETSIACAWHLPALHALESWGDTRAADGTTSIIQPLITPLFDGRSELNVIGALRGAPETSDRDRVRGRWQERAEDSGDFEGWWQTTLRQGFVADSAAAPTAPGDARLPASLENRAGSDRLEITFRASPAIWDGAFANNAWLQELPDALTKIVWGNAALVSESDASRLGIADGDMIKIATGNAEVEIPAHIAAGQAIGSISLTLGYGRTHAGAIGSFVGINVHPLRTQDGLWAADAEATPTGARSELIRTQTHDSMEGRGIVRRHSLEELASMVAGPNREPPSLYPDWPYEGAAWAMVIDQSVCIGCNACMVACQAENNVPSVGPEEVARGREMHWLRIDRYLEIERGKTEVLFQPMLCMHCEKAPCEPVCPVEASVHDGEGLNVQVYNRCIGTRFCEANCPYKVRRFNFFGYGDGHEYANLDNPLYRAVHNPDVSIRSRGVMEKCTYCVQRISRARRDAEGTGQAIRDGDVRTACQEACPTQAIVFGNRNDAGSAVTTLKREPHNYDLLGHLGTRPRTSYLARIRQTDKEVSS